MQHDRNLSLEALYGAERGAVFMTGIQALVRLPLMQRRLDRNRNLNTAGLVCGYRGPPLGAYDQPPWQAQAFIDTPEVVFQPGLNEALANKSISSAQMESAFGETTVEGVFGLGSAKGTG